MNTDNANSYYTRFSRYAQTIERTLEEPKKRSYSTVVLTFMTVSLFLWFAVKPTIQTILTLRKEIQDKTVLDRKLEAKIANLIEAQGIYLEAEPRLHLLTEALPVLPEALDEMRQVGAVAQTATATISAANINGIHLSESGKAKTDTKDKEFSYSTVATGTYESLENFLLELLGMRRIVKLKRYAFAPETEQAQKDTTSSLMKLTLQVMSYYQK